MRCGMSSSVETSGQSAAPMSGPIAICQPGNSAPAARRTSAAIACASSSSATTCRACPQSGNHRTRRDSVIDAKASSE
jgi:hypothetical protein